jgi:hypothetical protein
MQVKIKSIGKRVADLNAEVGHIPGTESGTTQVFVREGDKIKVLIDLKDKSTKSAFWQKKLVQNENGLFVLMSSETPAQVFGHELVMEKKDTQYRLGVKVTDKEGTKLGVFYGPVTNSPEEAKRLFWSTWNMKELNPFIPADRKTVHLRLAVMGYRTQEVASF